MREEDQRILASGIFGDNLFDVGRQLEEVGRTYDNRLSVGGRVQYGLSPRFALEGSFLFSPANIELAEVRLDEELLDEQARLRLHGGHEPGLATTR